MSAAHRVVSGWGGYPKQLAEVLAPLDTSEYKACLATHNSLIARGMGRSYGDSANASVVLETTCSDHFLDFDKATGVLTAEAGITLRTILRFAVPHGWFLPVTPGTSFVTLGGAVASDVHGKNHHGAGTFSEHIVSMTVLLGSGEVVTTSSSQLPDLFRATCGGMGLTGVILTVTLRLISIKSSLIRQRTIKANSLEEACEAFEEHRGAAYSVAWIDCLATGKNLGRSVLMLGEHHDDGGLDLIMNKPVSMPFYAPSSLLNRMTIGAFNSTYWAKAPNRESKIVPLLPYFYPLDAVGGWNKLYGKAGFLQYQFVLPRVDGVANMRTLLTQITSNGAGSFLSVLKKFGPSNSNLLSFPTEGYTLALDFKMEVNTVELLRKLDTLVVGMGGKTYLTKDAVMTERTFKACYPKWQEFEAVRQKYGATGKFSSSQSTRLGLA